MMAMLTFSSDSDMSMLLDFFSPLAPAAALGLAAPFMPPSAAPSASAGAGAAAGSAAGTKGGRGDAFASTRRAAWLSGQSNVQTLLACARFQCQS